ncbi:hypothetical protein D9V87_09825 [Bacteroidetes/Chlorobi group bacterium MS-B_bin-24]|jgi:hypothetical protein|nr:MAG: hypothetical protein D9V87_09825 [Bacteroidetes/Chlorobi group bacterium MS-B_bin-24]
MDFNTIMQGWGKKPKSQEAIQTYKLLGEILRSFFESQDIPFLWEAFWLYQGISLAQVEKWERKFGNQVWFKNAMQDMKMLFANKIAERSKFLGPENTKKLLERVLEQQTEKAIHISETIEIKQ